MAFETRFTMKYRDKSLTKYNIDVSKYYEHPSGKRGDDIYVYLTDKKEVDVTFTIEFDDRWLTIHDSDNSLRNILKAEGDSPLLESIIRDYIFGREVLSLKGSVVTFSFKSIWSDKLRKNEKGQWIIDRDSVIISQENRFARELILREFYSIYSTEGPKYLGPILEKCHYYSNSLRRSFDILKSRGFIKPSEKAKEVFHLTYEGARFVENTLLSPFTNKIFLIAACCDDIYALIENVYKPAVKELDYELIFQEKSEPKNSIHEDMWLNIENCKLVICDLTEKRPNCFIEYGYAHGKGKHIILAVEESQGKNKKGYMKLPFDTLTQKYSFWRREWLKDSQYKAQLKQFKDEIKDRVAEKLKLLDSRSDI